MTPPPGKLPTSRAFLDRLARKIGDPKDPRKPASDYHLAKVLGVTKSSISTIRTRKGAFGDDSALKVAELLGEPAGYVVACMHYERERSARVRVVWEAIAKAAAIGAVVVVSAAAQALGGTLPAAPSSALEFTGYTLCVRRHRSRRQVRAGVLRLARRHRRIRRRQLPLTLPAA